MIADLFATLKGKLGLDLEKCICINPYGDGDTEAGFVSTYDLDMDALNAEIDRFGQGLRIAIERELFEKAMRDRQCVHLDIGNDGFYVEPAIQNAWRGWLMAKGFV